jgi:hypothetical protein
VRQREEGRMSAAAHLLLHAMLDLLFQLQHLLALLLRQLELRATLPPAPAIIRTRRQGTRAPLTCLPATAWCTPRA